MPARLFVAVPLIEGAELSLPDGAARHAQVLRLQPGTALTLFDGSGAEWTGDVVRMGRSSVEVRVGARSPADRELAVQVTLALGMPSNERMDGVVEKATELGVAVIQPLICERSVLRLSGERADKRRAHWQSIAIAACEQSGRNRVPMIEPILTCAAWLAKLPETPAALPTSRWLLSTRAGAERRTDLHPRTGDQALIALSGPEGGLSDAEETAARECGFEAVSLGPRVLRADTAPLALLAHLGLQSLRSER